MAAQEFLLAVVILAQHALAPVLRQAVAHVVHLPP
jgi:hypothetical protein